MQGIPPGVGRPPPGVGIRVWHRTAGAHGLSAHGMPTGYALARSVGAHLALLMAYLDLKSQNLHLRRQIVLLHKEESNVHLVPGILKTKIFILSLIFGSCEFNELKFCVFNKWKKIIIELR